MRGLYFIEFRKPIAVDAAVKIESTMSLNDNHPDMLTIARVFSTMPEQRDGVAGTAFSYVTAFGSAVSIWLMLLYDYFFWAGTIDERPMGERKTAAIESP